MTLLQSSGVVTEAADEASYRRLCLSAPALATRLQPGQFVTADLGQVTRLPLIPSRIDVETVEFLLQPDNPAAALGPGQSVDLLGPLGKPLALPQPPMRLLLLADSLHVPFLLPAARRVLESGCLVTLLLGAATAAALYPPSLLPPALEIHLVTDDGSAGHAGTLLDGLAGGRQEAAPSLLAWADQVLVAADPVLYPRIAEMVRETRLRPTADYARAFLVPTVVCGVGACLGCSVAIRHGSHKVCTDGPAVDLMELEYD